MSATCPAIALRNVALSFTSPAGEVVPTLRDFTMEVPTGRFVALVGPTGCGKSTTLNLIAGLLKPVRGEVSVMGAPVTGIDRRVGFVFQADALFPWRTVIDNVAAGPLYRGMRRRDAYEQARIWTEVVGLSRFAAHYPHQLSGGMRKRVALAQTFVNGPEILLMDEPFSALDAQTRLIMQDELLRLWSRSNASVVFVTHDLEEAVALADTVHVLTAGPATIKSSYDIALNRPRVLSEIRYDPQFADISRQIWRDLSAEVSLGRGGLAA